MTNTTKRRDPLNKAAEFVRKLNREVELRKARDPRRGSTVPGEIWRFVRLIIKTLSAMALTSCILLALITGTGLVFGPEGLTFRGMLACLFILLASNGTILWWTVGRYFQGGRRSPADVPTSLPKATQDIALLPAHTDTWLESQRALLPLASQRRLDGIGIKLEALRIQLKDAAQTEKPTFAAVRRLLNDELPELINSYRRLPRELTHKPTHGGSTPENQLVDGLATIEEQLAKLQEEIAADDVRALATHQHYLDLKYKGDKLDE